MDLPPEASRYVTEWLGPGWRATPLAGDASVRAYYRVTTPGGKTYMLAYYPEEVRPQLRRFLRAYDAVAAQAPVPEVLQSCDLAVLQFDAGDRTLFDVLHEDREEGIRLYRAAIDLLAGFQGGRTSRPPREADETSALLNPPFTADFFFSELQMAREFYVEKLMGFADGEELQSMMRTICDDIARHPYVLCHRDFHGQNIHITNDELYLIDYQDLRMGPDTYDMASLLRDRGVARILGDETELELLGHYRHRVSADDGIRRRYFETLLQRSIKILGTFSKQPIVRGRTHYLDFIPATLESIQRCIDELPAYARLRDIFPLRFSLEQARERARSLYGET
ncbi:MAG TPA: phosphotransferase [Thermoanaerobaculia bacterium]|nr:phosphotransferase [Thermoanaerobaculia bacterium]